MTTIQYKKMTFIQEPGSLEATSIREFDATPLMVFRAHTEAALLEQWWGPRRYKTRVDALDARHGGLWRFVNVADDGSEHHFRGVFHGDPSVADGIIQTWEYEDLPMGVAFQRLTLEELPGGRTRMTAHMLYEKVEQRDGHAEAGAIEGGEESYERLDELLATQ